MKKFLLLFALFVSISLLYTSVLADEEPFKRNYDANANTISWEADFCNAVFIGSSASNITYDNNNRIDTITFSSPVQVQLIGLFDIANIYKKVGDVILYDNLITTVSDSGVYTESNNMKKQTNTVTLAEGEYSISFILNYGTYATGDSIKIKVGNDNNSTAPTTQDPSTVVFDKNRSAYITNATSLPQGANISDWAVNEVNEAFSKSIVPVNIYNEGNYQRPITRKEFAYIVVGSLKAFNFSFDELISNFVNVGFSSEFIDTDNDIMVQIAKNRTIINGTSENTFSPNDNLTREEAAAMLYRLYDRGQLITEIGTPVFQEYKQFNDSDKFNMWSYASIMFVSSVSEPNSGRVVMGGIGNNEFDPSGTLTVEQALIATKRLVSFIEDRMN